MSFTATNLLLQALPSEVYTRLARHLEAIKLPAGTVLFHEEKSSLYVHFLTSGIASLVVRMKDGGGIQIGLTGNEGFAETARILGSQVGSPRCFMLTRGTGLRMDIRRFQEEILSTPALMRVVYQYVQHDSLVMARIAACNRLHEVHGRLARWLLMVQDRVEGSDIDITQESLAEVLGTRRSTISLAANGLQNSGAIAYSRGKIRIAERGRLESVACECYPIIARLFRGLYKV